MITDELKKIPKNFYTNHRTNMIRDAHYMAKAIVNNRSNSPMAACLGTCGENGQATIKCNCKPIKDRIRSTKFRSFTGGIQSRARSKNITKKAYDMHKPYRPCRRTCCSNHNPLFHAQRMQQEHLQRMHASATKLMIMSVIPERPYSADTATRELKQYQRDIDYFQTTIHGEALERKETLKRKKTKRTSSIEGIEERGEMEEDDGGRSRLKLSNSRIPITQSNMNLMQN